MAYQQTSATDYDDLLDKLVTFAVAAGWTQSYNAAGPPRQIGLYKGDCHISWGARIGENPISRGSGQSDAIINGALATSLDSGNIQYWGHPGSIVTSSTDVDRIQVNDLYGALTNVWFFSGADYIHVVVQAGGARYVHFGFGALDPLGQTHPNVVFAVGGMYYWWDESWYCNRPDDSTHAFGHLAREAHGQVRILAGTLPANYPAAGIHRTNTVMTQVMTRVSTDAAHWAASSGRALDFFFPVDNELTTGGTSLYSIPWLIQETGTTSHVHLGRLPGIRLSNIAQLAPAAELAQGADTWAIFPWKRKGLKVNLGVGGSPIQVCNTAGYAWAYKKNV